MDLSLERMWASLILPTLIIHYSWGPIGLRRCWLWCDFAVCSSSFPQPYILPPVTNYNNFASVLKLKKVEFQRTFFTVQLLFLLQLFRRISFCCSFYFWAPSGVIFQRTRVNKIETFFESTPSISFCGRWSVSYTVMAVEKGWGGEKKSLRNQGWGRI